MITTLFIQLMEKEIKVEFSNCQIYRHVKTTKSLKEMFPLIYNCIVFNKRKRCLPYILASQGYDVWIGNNRGTQYSWKDFDRKNYWNFSFDHFV